MRTIGKLTSWAVFAAVVGAVVVGVRSLPDIQRYQRIRSM
ncbi:MAG: DUF6893 family small protein [Actinomycetes bacterium]